MSLSAGCFALVLFFCSRRACSDTVEHRLSMAGFRERLWKGSSAAGWWATAAGCEFTLLHSRRAVLMLIQ